MSTVQRNTRPKVDKKKVIKRVKQIKRNQKRQGKWNQEKKRVEKVDKTFKEPQKTMDLVPNNNQRAQGVRTNIKVNVTCSPTFIECLPLPLISRGVIFNVNTTSSPLYWAYIGFLNDIKAIMSGQVSPLTCRAKYVNELITSWAPKNIPFKTGTISYSWANVDAISTNPVISVRGYNTYLYVPGATYFGEYSVQVAPPAPSSTVDIYTKLNSLYTSLGDTKGDCLRVVNIPSETEYGKDVSAYVATEEYYGQGCSAKVGPSYSVESEVPFHSRLISGSAPYAPAETRVARVFGLASGDGPTAFGFPFIPEWRMRFYKTCYPPIYKFMDLDEVVVTLQQWYCTLVGQTLKLGNGSNIDTLADCLLPFECSAQDFRIMIRQALASFYASTWGMTQTMTPATDTNGFEPFRSGTNAAPVNRQAIRLPLLLAENLRMLLPAYGEIPTKFFNEKNVVSYIPVWGIYRSVENNPYNIIGTFAKDNGSGGQEIFNSPLCTGDNTKSPNPIDGKGPSNECVDLNSAYIGTLIEEWNDRITKLTAVSGSTTLLSGSSATTLLTYTRYSAYQEFDKIKVAEIPKFKRKELNPAYITKVKRQSLKLNKTCNLKEKELYTEEEEFYVPPQFSLERQNTNAFGSMQTITEEVRQLFQYLIFPTIALTDGGEPSQGGARIQNLEGDVMDMTPQQFLGLGSRFNQLVSYANIMAPGLATNNTADELMNVVLKLSESNEGGFLGDLLTGVATVLLPQIPI